jgi:hypothetical protein
MSARDYAGLYDRYSSIGAEFWIVAIAFAVFVLINLGHIVYVVSDTVRSRRVLDKEGIVRVLGSITLVGIAVLAMIFMPSIEKRKSESSKKAMTEYNVSDINSLGKNIKYLNKKLDELKKEYPNLEDIIGKKSVYHPPVRYKLGTTYHTRPAYYIHRLDSEKFINYTLELWYNGDVANLGEYFKGLDIDKLASDLNNNLVH